MSDAEEPQQSPGNTSNSRSRRWMFTINNPSIPAGVFPFTNDRDLVKYLVYQRECGDASSLPHNQGFCILKHAVTLNRLKKACNRAHFEIARGSLKQCIDYCTKDDTRISGPYRFGDEPKVGGSTVALDDLREGIKDGTLKSMRDVVMHHHYRTTRASVFLNTQLRLIDLRKLVIGLTLRLLGVLSSNVLIIVLKMILASPVLIALETSQRLVGVLSLLMT